MSELILDVGQVNELKMALRRAGYGAGEVKRLTEGDILARVREVLLDRAQIVPIKASTIQPVEVACSILTVPPGLTFAERIIAGNYDWTNSNVGEKRFPHDPMTIGEWEFDLFHPNRNISSENAKKEAEVDGWVVAKWEHLFAYGKAFPEKQKKFPIIALGSVYCGRGDHRVLALGFWLGRSKRQVVLRHWDNVWLPRSHFLRVRKVSTSVA